jgi:hypothetical protein
VQRRWWGGGGELHTGDLLATKSRERGDGRKKKNKKAGKEELKQKRKGRGTLKMIGGGGM